MSELKDLFQSADWKKEKHVPAIDAPDSAKKGEFFKVTVTVGKEIAHPNTTEHHIRWIEVYFLADGEKFPYQIGKFEFTAHGESVPGPNMSTIYTHPEVVCALKTDKAGTLFASSYCNIHGLWQSAKRVSVI
ncbi:MAG: class II SORL domain-containing protein [Candidatus Omnitrophica bacterium]|nr:class II SORL domain-containing protein [Candidatus Omnitrophota bacterium]